MNERFAGFGLVKVIEIYENAIWALTQIVVSCVLCYPMFFSDVPASRPQFLFLNNPVCIVVLVAILCGITVLSPVLSNWAKKYWAGLAQKATQQNRLYSFYVFFANDDRRAPDIRIYPTLILSSTVLSFLPFFRISICRRFVLKKM